MERQVELDGDAIRQIVDRHAVDAMLAIRGGADTFLAIHDAINAAVVSAQAKILLNLVVRKEQHGNR